MMADAYIGLFYIPATDEIDIPILAVEPTISISEVTEKSKYGFISNARISCSNVDLTSGSISFVKVSRRPAPIQAVINLFGLRHAESEVGDTIHIGDGTDVYTFVEPSYVGSDINRVALGRTIVETMTNLYKAINGVGTLTGVYYNVEDCATCTAQWVTETSIILIHKMPGIVGNSTAVVSSNPDSIAIGTPSNSASSGYFKEGATESNEIINIDSFIVDWEETDNIGLFYIQDMSYSPDGVRQEFEVSFYNSNGAVATLNGNLYIYTEIVVFNGEVDADTIGEYAPVLNLVCLSANNEYGGTSYSVPALLPKSGIARLAWSDMSIFNRTLYDYPVAKKKIDNSQEVTNISVKQLKNIKEYSIFMFIPLRNENADPLYPYPNSYETLGLWILCGRTTSTHFDISPPIDMVVSFWVGFGSPKTGLESIGLNSYKTSTFVSEQYYSYPFVEGITDDLGRLAPTDDIGRGLPTT